MIASTTTTGTRCCTSLGSSRAEVDEDARRLHAVRRPRHDRGADVCNVYVPVSAAVMPRAKRCVSIGCCVRWGTEEEKNKTEGLGQPQKGGLFGGGHLDHWKHWDQHWPRSTTSEGKLDLKRSHEFCRRSLSPHG
jgi:hypothetical protein